MKKRLQPFLLLVLLIAPASAQNFAFLDDEAEPGGYDVSATLKALPLEWALSQNENGDGYRLKIAADGLVLQKKRGANLQTLASVKTKIAPNTAFVAQRRGPRWNVILGPRVVLRAEDDSFSQGQIGYRAALNAVQNPRVQPIEPITFNDDFMRVAKEVALEGSRANPRQGIKVSGVQNAEEIWHPLKGKWATTGLTENEAAQVAQSANPFAFKPAAPGANFAVAGRPFWSDYSAEISVQPQGATLIGFTVYSQDEKNVLGLFWPQNGAPQLRALIDGQTRVLDEANDFGAFENEQWYRLKISVAGGQLRAFIDDIEVLRARTGLFGRGQIGVWAEAEKPEKSAVFDDATVRSDFNFYDDFSQPVPGRWQTVSGAWKFADAAQPTDQKGAFAVMGEGGWNDYAVAADIFLPADGSAGLVLHHIAGKGAYLLRAAGSKANLPYAGRVQILKIAGGKTEVLGEAATGARFDNSRERWSFAGQNGYLRALADETQIADAFDETLPEGRAGVYAQKGAGQTPQITQLSVEFDQKKPTWAKVPELYELEQQAVSMGGWSTPQGFWVAHAPEKGAPTAADSRTLWHKGAFWGENTLRFALPDLTGGKSVKLIFNVPTGRDLTLELKDALAANLSDGTKSWNGIAKVETAAGTPVEVARRGNFVIVKVGKEAAQKTVLAARVS